jgi:SNF family Na+-dependent transporter
MTYKKQAWGSRIGLILAMAGNAVGLGNFLRFPLQAIQNGGGTFIIPYLVSFVLLGLPLMLIEWSTGKYGGMKGHHSPPMIMQQLDNKHKFWKYTGAMGIFSSLIISSYYCYIESWTLSYTFHSIKRTFEGMSENQISAFFDNYLDLGTTTTGIPYEPVIFFIICLLLNVWILSKGLKNGIERVAKICMPLLVIFGLFLTYKAFTLKAGTDGAILDGLAGFNFLWEPQFDSLTNPKVWLAAAGQVFFTLSLGMGCIQSYASYMKRRDDIVLNSMTAGFTNEFIEIIIGSAIIIPISIGYFGIDKVIALAETGGFGLGFRTMPYLFEQWGGVLAALAGLAFFGLLFFAGITSTLALATPSVAFFSRSYGWSQKKGAYIFGIAILILGLPTIFFFSEGVFDQYDYWGGTVALFVFAMIESVLFSWVMGVEKGWKLIHLGAEMRLPVIFKFILKYITPTMFILIFVSALIKPKNDDWSLLSFKGWELDNMSIIAELNHQGIGPNKDWFSNEFYAENSGTVTSIRQNENKIDITLGENENFRTYSFKDKNTPAVSEGDYIQTGDILYTGKIINNVFYIDATRIMLLLLLVIICILIRDASKERKKKGII